MKTGGPCISVNCHWMRFAIVGWVDWWGGRENNTASKSAKKKPKSNRRVVPATYHLIIKGLTIRQRRQGRNRIE
jgi:hypothetical protein